MICYLSNYYRSAQPTLFLMLNTTQSDLGPAPDPRKKSLNPDQDPYKMICFFGSASQIRIRHTASGGCMQILFDYQKHLDSAKNLIYSIMNSNYNSKINI